MALIAVATFEPDGLGRVVRSEDGGEVLRIIEDKDATPDELAIDEINAKLESGIFNFERDIKDISVNVDEVKLSFDYEQVTILFLKHEYEDFMKVIAELEDLKKAKDVMLCGLDQFDVFREMIQTVSKKNNVRNIAAIKTTMMSIVKTALTETKETTLQTQ